MSASVLSYQLLQGPPVGDGRGLWNWCYIVGGEGDGDGGVRGWGGGGCCGVGWLFVWAVVGLVVCEMCWCD